jgi:DNA-binding NarL/FixJ family response regulator
MLTDRESEVLILIAGGNSTKEIAYQLGIGFRTADSHRFHLMMKLNLHKAADLTRYAIRTGLIQP